MVFGWRWTLYQTIFLLKLFSGSKTRYKFMKKHTLPHQWSSPRKPSPPIGWTFSHRLPLLLSLPSTHSFSLSIPLTLSLFPQGAAHRGWQLSQGHDDLIVRGLAHWTLTPYGAGEQWLMAGGAGARHLALRPRADEGSRPLRIMLWWVLVISDNRMCGTNYLHELMC